MNEKNLLLDKDYLLFLEYLKNKIKDAQNKAIFSVNKELILLYWDIGKNILKKEEKEGWGSKIIDKISYDLTNSFPNLKGFSIRNLKYMRKFAKVYSNIEIVQQPVAQIPWGHNIILLEKIKVVNEAVWYAKQVILNGWSRNVLLNFIESDLYSRKENALNNFKETLPSFQSNLAKETFRDSYIFDFISYSNKLQESELENQLINNISKFLIELGSGFAFVGKQYHLEISKKDYYLDLLFYHLKLRCYIVIELKSGDFKPEYIGKMNFYLSAVDDLLKNKADNSSIGIILCKNKDEVTVKYALRNLKKPVGISEYKLVKSIPKELKLNFSELDNLKKNLINELKDKPNI
ncbi:MAG: PDDEXK nuclease domain-containing protein [archaeon]